MQKFLCIVCVRLYWCKWKIKNWTSDPPAVKTVDHQHWIIHIISGCLALIYDLLKGNVWSAEVTEVILLCVLTVWLFNITIKLALFVSPSSTVCETVLIGAT